MLRQKFIRVGLVVVMLSAFAWCAASARANIIYQDTFAGTGDLADHTLDTTTNGNTWTVSPSGSFTVQSGAKVNSGQATLPFTPPTAGGYIYTLSADVTIAPTTSTNWIALGFSRTVADSGVDSAGMYYNLVDWTLVRDTGGTYTAIGPGTSTLMAAPDVTPGDLLHLSVILDTTAANWEATWHIGDGFERSYTYTSGKPDINYVTMVDTGPTATFTNFTLSAIQTPEPSALTLLGLGLLGLLAYAWRRRK